MARRTNRVTPHTRNGRIAFEILIAVVVIVAVIYRQYTCLHLDQQLADLRARGLLTNGEELNAWYSVPPDVRDTTEQWIAATRATAKLKIGSGDRMLPFVGLGSTPVPPPGQEWAELNDSRLFLKECESEIQLIMDAAEAGGIARYPVDFREGLSARIIDQHETRNLARILSLSAHVQAHDGQFQNALGDLKSIFAVSRSIDREPLMISQMIRNAVCAMGCVATVQLLPYCDWSDKELQELQTAIGQIVLRKSTQHAFYGQLAIFLDDPKSVLNSSTFGAAVFRESALSKAIEMIDRPARALDLSWMDTVETFDATWKEIMTNPPGALSPVISRVVMWHLPVLQQAIASGMRTETRQNCCIAVIAAQRYRLKHSKLPGTLADLIDFIPDADASKSTRLIDPFDGKPLRFKEIGKSIVIYSVGANRLDDDGDVDMERRVAPDFGFLISE